MFVKIPDGKRLHMLKHFIPDPLQNALPDFYHQPAVGKRADHADDKDACQNRQRLV